MRTILGLPWLAWLIVAFAALLAHGLVEAHCGPTIFIVREVVEGLDHHEGSVVGLATIALFIATFGLWLATRALVIDAKETSRAELRAYVGIRPHPDVKPSLDELHFKGMIFTVVNYGKTPAHEVENKVAMGEFADEPVFTPMDFSKPGSRFVLFPGATSDIYIKRRAPFTGEEKAKILEGRTRIYAWGELRYRDVFGGERRTVFRLRQEPGSSMLLFTEEGNSAT